MLASLESDCRKVALWNAQKGTKLHVFQEKSLFPLVFSPEGKMLSFVTRVGRLVKLWDTNTGAELQVSNENENSLSVFPLAISFLPGGEMLVLVSEDGITELWNIDTGYMQLIANSPRIITNAALSLDGKVLALVWNDDAAVIIHNISRGAELRIFGDYWNPISIVAMTFSPNGKLLAFASGRFNEASASLYDTTTGELLYRAK